MFFISLSVASSTNYKIWTENATKRVLKFDVPKNNREVVFSAAQNEWQSFQIIINSNTIVSNVTIEPNDLVDSQNNIISKSNFDLYRQHYFKIDEPSYKNYNFKKGHYPDALIPFCHPITKKPLNGTLKAVPFSVPENENVGFWVDLYVPLETQPGDYIGNFYIKSNDEIIANIKVRLKIWGFALPQSPSLKTHFGSTEFHMKQYFDVLNEMGLDKMRMGERDWNSIHKQVSTLESQHRINASPKIDSFMIKEKNGTFYVTEKEISNLQSFIDTYNINTLEVPINVKSNNRLEYLLVKLNNSEEKFIKWLKYWNEIVDKLNRPHVDLVIYIYDEPNDENSYQRIRNAGKLIKSVDTVVKVLVTEQTTPDMDGDWGNLYGAIDIWCPHFVGYNEKSARERQELGEEIWAYTAMTHNVRAPYWQTDYPLLHYRVPSWIMWKYDITGLLYWNLAYWNKKPYDNPVTWKAGDLKQYSYNGDGLIVYPAEIVGYQGIVPSIRLKAIRDSIEDYEYFKILEKIEERKNIDKVIKNGISSWRYWDEDPTVYDDLREKLASMIEKKMGKK